MENSFGWLVHKKRNVMQISIRELAKRVGVDAGYISKIEKGQTANPSFSTVMKLAKELHLEIPSLMRGFNLDEEMEDIIEGSIKNIGVPREHKDLIQGIMKNIVNFTNEESINGSLLAEVFAQIFSLQKQRNQKKEMFFVITIVERRWVNILRTPFLDETFLSLYYQAYAIDERDTFIVKGDLLSLPDFVEETQILTLEGMLNECYTVEEDDEFYEVYMDMRTYLEKVLLNSK